MGNYLNPGNRGFCESLNSEIYVDKSGLIRATNSVLGTRRKYMCVSRPRRFGKSMAADMLSAYYSKGASSEELFTGLEAESLPDFRKHLNKYNVVKLNMQRFMGTSADVVGMIDKIQRFLVLDIKDAYGNIMLRDEDDFVQVMMDVYDYSKCPFVILIDEWDCLFREWKYDNDSRKIYLDFLRTWLKDQEYVALAYMTGILPVKKYGTHSALNMFTEYSMTNTLDLTPYFGFTEDEVRSLCEKYSMPFEEAKAWYDGYDMTGLEAGRQTTFSIYSPKSVDDAMIGRIYDNYWNRTETYEALKVYIRLDFDGLKDCVVKMLAGESIPINTGTFTNDMTTFSCRDDVLTLLVHLGYLSYDWTRKTVCIPNKEVAQEYVNAISTLDWPEVTRTLMESKQLLEALWNLDGDSVALGIERTHNEMSVLEYNDENSLCCTIQLAFYFAREYYTVIREFPTGKGFADICLIPRKAHLDKPAAVIELKMDKPVSGAIAQIKERDYPAALSDYQGNLLLAGISYDKKTKVHSCVIEKFSRRP